MRVLLDPLWVGSWLRLPPAPMLTLGILLLFSLDVGLQQNVTEKAKKDTTKEVRVVQHYYTVCGVQYGSQRTDIAIYILLHSQLHIGNNNGHYSRAQPIAMFSYYWRY